MKHKIPEYLKDLEQVANDISDMPYDEVAYFLHSLQLKLEKDSKNDEKGGRLKLSKELKIAALETETLKERFIKIWSICEKYMI